MPLRLAVQVLPETARAVSIVDANGGQWDESLVALIARLGPQSPLELQLNGAAYGNGIYLSPDVSMSADARLEPSTS